MNMTTVMPMKVTVTIYLQVLLNCDVSCALRLQVEYDVCTTDLAGVISVDSELHY